MDNLKGKGRWLLSFVIISLFVLVLAAPGVEASPSGQDEPTPTYTPTLPSVTATYQAAFAFYKTAATDNITWGIMAEAFCLVGFVAVITIGVVSFLKSHPRRRRRRR
jgi:hypothetical protein